MGHEIQQFISGLKDQASLLQRQQKLDQDQELFDIQIGNERLKATFLDQQLESDATIRGLQEDIFQSQANALEKTRLQGLATEAGNTAVLGTRLPTEAEQFTLDQGGHAVPPSALASPQAFETWLEARLGVDVTSGAEAERAFQTQKLTAELESRSNIVLGRFLAGERNFDDVEMTLLRQQGITVEKDPFASLRIGADEEEIIAPPPAEDLPQIPDFSALKGFEPIFDESGQIIDFRPVEGPVPITPIEEAPPITSAPAEVDEGARALVGAFEEPEVPVIVPGELEPSGAGLHDNQVRDFEELVDLAQAGGATTDLEVRSMIRQLGRDPSTAPSTKQTIDNFFADEKTIAKYTQDTLTSRAKWDVSITQSKDDVETGRETKTVEMASGQIMLYVEKRQHWLDRMDDKERLEANRAKQIATATETASNLGIPFEEAAKLQGLEPTPSELVTGERRIGKLEILEEEVISERKLGVSTAIIAVRAALSTAISDAGVLQSGNRMVFQESSLRPGGAQRLTLPAAIDNLIGDLVTLSLKESKIPGEDKLSLEEFMDVVVTDFVSNLTRDDLGTSAVGQFITGELLGLPDIAPGVGVKQLQDEITARFKEIAKKRLESRPLPGAQTEAPFVSRERRERRQAPSPQTEEVAPELSSPPTRLLGGVK